MSDFPKRDLTGKRFGRLVAVYPFRNNKTSRNRWYWHCVCTCGNEKDVEAYTLLSGKVRSCGCLLKEMSAKRSLKDLTGRKFGRLKVIKRADNKYNRASWLCRCDCGNTAIVAGSSLLSGATQSCGCLHTEKSREMRPVINARHTVNGAIAPLLRSKLRKDNKTGYKGVYKRKINNIDYYSAEIGYKNKKIVLGTFSKIEDAIYARKKAEEKYFKPILDKENKK